MAICRPRIKVCCISSVGEAHLAVRLGASALGLVSSMPSGPGVIDGALIAEIIATVPPGVATFLLTSRQDADAIVDQQRHARSNVIQLCDRVSLAEHKRLRAALPGIGLVQVVHVTSHDALDEAIEASQTVDAILLDSGNPNLEVKSLGGTGNTHDWDVSARIRAAITKPLYLAGGLNPSNVAEAVTRVRPFGLDVCSGVRTDGKLDEAKLAEFVERSVVG